MGHAVRRTNAMTGPGMVLQRFRRTLARAETALAGLSLLLLIGLTLAQIVARNLFDAGLPALDTFTRHLVLYILFFGATLAAESERHIRIDVVSAWLAQRTLERLQRPLSALAALVCAAFAYAALRFWLDEWQYAAAAERWQTLMNFILPLGFGLLSLHLLLVALLGPTVRTRQ